MQKSQTTRKISLETLEARKPSVKQLEVIPQFVGIKLKKSEIVKRSWEDATVESVDLRHHLFEEGPMREAPEQATAIALSSPLEDIPEPSTPKLTDKKKLKKPVSHLNFGMFGVGMKLISCHHRLSKKRRNRQNQTFHKRGK